VRRDPCSRDGSHRRKPRSPALLWLEHDDRPFPVLRWPMLRRAVVRTPKPSRMNLSPFSPIPGTSPCPRPDCIGLSQIGSAAARGRFRFGSDFFRSGLDPIKCPEQMTAVGSEWQDLTGFEHVVQVLAGSCGRSTAGQNRAIRRSRTPIAACAGTANVRIASCNCSTLRTLSITDSVGSRRWSIISARHRSANPFHCLCDHTLSL